MLRALQTFVQYCVLGPFFGVAAEFSEAAHLNAI